jgi:site-specific recombinase XerD
MRPQPRRVAELTRDPLQECLNQITARGDSFSAVKKARTYITAALEFALDEQLITRNAGRKLELPSKRLRKSCGRFLSLDEVHRLLSAAGAIAGLLHLMRIRDKEGSFTIPARRDQKSRSHSSQHCGDLSHHTVLHP